MDNSIYEKRACNFCNFCNVFYLQGLKSVFCTIKNVMPYKKNVRHYKKPFVILECIVHCYQCLMDVFDKNYKNYKSKINIWSAA